MHDIAKIHKLSTFGRVAPGGDSFFGQIVYWRDRSDVTDTAGYRGWYGDVSGPRTSHFSATSQQPSVNLLSTFHQPSINLPRAKII